MGTATPRTPMHMGPRTATAIPMRTDIPMVLAWPSATRASMEALAVPIGMGTDLVEATAEACAAALVVRGVDSGAAGAGKVARLSELAKQPRALDHFS